MFRGTCEFCGEAVRTDQKAAFRVRGWEIERAAGGANYIAGKERQPERIVHAVCVEIELRADKLGLRGQMSL
jgi:hypothetical protein